MCIQAWGVVIWRYKVFPRVHALYLLHRLNNVCCRFRQVCLSAEAAWKHVLQGNGKIKTGFSTSPAAK